MINNNYLWCRVVFYLHKWIQLIGESDINLSLESCLAWKNNTQTHKQFVIVSVEKISIDQNDNVFFISIKSRRQEKSTNYIFVMIMICNLTNNYK